MVAEEHSEYLQRAEQRRQKIRQRGLLLQLVFFHDDHLSSLDNTRDSDEETNEAATSHNRPGHIRHLPRPMLQNQRPLGRHMKYLFAAAIDVTR